MENKNITFCHCKLSKNNIKPDQNFTYYKKHGGSGLTARHMEYQKQKKKVNKLWQKIIRTT